MIWAVGDLVRGLALHAENDRCHNNDEREREIERKKGVALCNLSSS
jgi:hypothetical protein